MLLEDFYQFLDAPINLIQGLIAITFEILFIGGIFIFFMFNYLIGFDDTSVVLLEWVTYKNDIKNAIIHFLKISLPQTKTRKICVSEDFA